MARRSLRPQLNQIRAWVQQGRTDAWIAHQLEVTTQQIDAFKRENDLAPGGATEAAAGNGTDFDDEIDLRAQDDELIAAELEQAEAERAAREAEEAERKAAEAERKAAEAAERKAAREAERKAAKAAKEAKEAKGDDEGEDEDDDEEKPKRARGRRGGRGRTRRRKAGEPLEGTFDHGEEGYGLWLDPAVADDPVYAEYWAGHRPITVTIEADQIVIRRSGEEDSDDNGDDDAE